MKPIIGVTPLYDAYNNKVWMMPDYLDAIDEAGGLPVILPLTADKVKIAQLASLCDGYLIPGGQDVDPAFYNEKALECCGKISAPRDALETVLVDLLIEADKPLLGICRGFQLINIRLGGAMYQDLPTQFAAPENAVIHDQEEPYDAPCHAVRIVPGTLLHSIVGESEIGVNSRHHQGVKRFASRLTAAAYAPDELVEAAYMPEKKFVLAVQWHPELMFRKDEAQRRIFGAFVRAADAAAQGGK